MIRQGDILFIPIEQIPHATPSADGPYLDKRVVAEGEKTGHAHVIVSPSVRMFATLPEPTVRERLEGDGLETRRARMARARKYLRVVEPSEVVHPEHATVMLPPGNYAVRQQREWEGEPRIVED